LLGILYAALGAFTFALNNVAMRRGVVTGSVLQAMALTVPIGGFSFLVMTVAFGELGQLVLFPTVAFTWLAGQGVVHFVLGRYCNYKSNQLMGVNLAAPVVQLQVPVAMMLAVVTLHEKFTVLQLFGSGLMLGGSFITQSNTGKGKKASGSPPAAAPIAEFGDTFARACARRIDAFEDDILEIADQTEDDYRETLTGRMVPNKELVAALEGPHRKPAMADGSARPEAMGW
jgi:uncharacterized membrane protein